MSDSRINQKDIRLKQKDFRKYKKLDDSKDLHNIYLQLINENQKLNVENEVLKGLILEKGSKDTLISSFEDLNKSNQFNKTKIKKDFYIQIILGLLIIILSLGFHIVYLSVTNCLLFNNGDSSCWIKSWLGLNIHASFFIDLFLYSLIVLQSVLIILIIRSKIYEFKSKI